ncbi:MAG: hypothetical protein ACRDBG_24795 [Waterburya sp.]
MAKLAGKPTNYDEVWDREIQSYSPKEVVEYCVNDAVWQTCRLSMKGVNTNEKLRILRGWRAKNELANNGVVDRRCQVQIDNYINALKRGGQIDMQNKVAK